MNELRIGLSIVFGAVLIALVISMFTGEWILMLPILALAVGVMFGIVMRWWWDGVMQELEADEARKRSMGNHPSASLPPMPVRSRLGRPVLGAEDDPNWTRYTHGLDGDQP